MLKKLPVGIQTFKDIIEENRLYIDKTEIAYELIDNYKYVFLSRPRRFGKSLFMDTLHNIFEGNKEYFKDLAIESKWNWDIKYPVIKIAFGKVRSSEDLKQTIHKILNSNQERLEVICNKEYDYANCFGDLIQKASQKYNQKVVILIDEYDKPILDNIENQEVAVENREILSRFYTEIKNADEFIKFAMLTGVSKFSKASIFSGLNMIEDISLTPKFGDICGYTQDDIETSFLPYLKEQDFEKIKKWYNGYNFLKSNVYNPFDILKFIKNDFVYDNYWFESGTPTFLIKLIKQKNYFLPNLSNLVVDKKILSSFDIENLDLEVILFQAGYLTIKKVEIDEDEDILYTLEIPNKEVKISLNKYIITYLFKNDTSKAKLLSKALRNNDLEEFKNSLISLFASIPYNNYTKNDIANYEGFYASVIYVYLQSLGLDIVGEDVTNKGRIDLTIIMEDSIYIIEFKVGSKDALAQIKEKNYAKKYLDKNKDIYLMGINFDEKEKNISKFEWEIITY